MHKSLTDALMRNTAKAERHARAVPTYEGDQEAAAVAVADLKAALDVKRREKARVTYVIWVWHDDEWIDLCERDNTSDGLSNAATYVAKQRVEAVPAICLRVERMDDGTTPQTCCRDDLAEAVREACDERGLSYPDWTDPTGACERERQAGAAHDYAAQVRGDYVFAQTGR